MSMEAFWLLEFVKITMIYIALTLLLPAIVFRRFLRGQSVCRQFLLCFVIGNFYLINLVLLLQLLHISNRFTLIAGTAVPAFPAWVKINRIPLKKWNRTVFYELKKLADGETGFKSVCWKIGMLIQELLRKLREIVFRHFVRKPFQTAWLLAVILGIAWVYGRQLIVTYGYRAGDIPVHLSWINGMSRGEMFKGGVYPFGYHCIIYYLHVVGGVDSYLIMCQFFLVQVLMQHLILLAFLKCFCKNRFLPYAGVLFFVMGSFWVPQTYERFTSPLPQEYGMLFVLPAFYFATAFLQTPVKKMMRKRFWRNADLMGFVMSISLTLAIHFYDTIIAALCCVGIAVGFAFRLIHMKYLRKIVAAGLLGIFVAVIPLAAAYATGTPLEGSINWGMSIIRGGSAAGNEDSDSEEEPSEDELSEEESMEEAEETETSEEAEALDVEASELTDDMTETSKPAPKTFRDRMHDLQVRLMSVRDSVIWRVETYIISGMTEHTGYLVLFVAGAVPLLGLLFLLRKKRNYGGACLAVGVSTALLLLLLCADFLGLPTLMDMVRCSVYFACFLAVEIVILGDELLLVIEKIAGLFTKKKFKNVLSFVLSAAVLVSMLAAGKVRMPAYKSEFVSNGAVICLTNIIHDNPDGTWTIVSANDETQMGMDHGYHYETNNFLRTMEKLEKDTELLIPTRNVYFFVEKIPLSYAGYYWRTGQSISVEGAAQKLPDVGGSIMYRGEYRWILMSRMEQWVQAFRKEYPQEMQVYYESEDFICYKIEQNMYHLYNFAIDYGYNQVVE